MNSNLMKRLIMATLTLGFWLVGSAADEQASRPTTPIPAERCSAGVLARRYTSASHLAGAVRAGCGIVAIFTVPDWPTPWYKGIRNRDDDA